MKRKSLDAEPTANADTSLKDPDPLQPGSAATADADVARKVAHLTPGERVARGKAARNEVPAMAVGSRTSTGPTLLGYSRSRR